KGASIQEVKDHIKAFTHDIEHRIELTVDDRTAECLDTESTFAVEFVCDLASQQKLKVGLERIFMGTDCRFRIKVGDLISNGYRWF
ncbi:MAG TPA: hypothetical protein VJM12_16995, partial [Pyrinomonadaceae bacterium]|nr:hypothetical protein [Pyrinomonadaceae bacterium]